MAVILARRFKLIDIPGASGHKQHENPTPMAGGLVLASTFLIVGYFFDWYSTTANGAIMAGAGIILIFGLLDDALGLNAPQKILGQALAATLLVGTGTQVHLLAIEWINLTLTYLWVIGLVNAFNLVDSMDGLALGLAGIAAAFIFLVTIEAGQPQLTAISAGVFGACIGLAFFNLPPAKMFLGDSGAQLLGFLMAAVGMAYNPVDLPKLSSWFVPILVLGMPIFDTTLVVYSRLKRGVKVYRASRDHTYHRLCQLGLEPTRAIFTMHLAAIILGFIAFISLNMSAPIGNVSFILTVLAGLGMVLALVRWTDVG